VLQEGEFDRVGSSTPRRADVRVIATTTRNLDEWVSKKRFRADLYYRLNVLPVRLPPLREHAEDIPELVMYFLQEAAAADGSRPLRVGAGAMKLLSEYCWPGNVRELENLCRRAVTLSTGDVMTPELIEPWLTANTATVDGLGSLRDGRMLEDMERRLIERTLAKHNGHRVKSAKALGMGVRTLGMKLKQWREEAEAQRAFAGEPVGAV
jgi:DNA-binding NtrC family response regulator